jgi:hypothetical protein
MNEKKKIVAGLIAAVTIVIIAAIVLICTFALPQKKETVTETSIETTTASPETTTSDPNKGKTISFLTGEYVKTSIAKRRPVALMYNNIINAIPHSGIGNASVCYEAPVEGGITRIMGIFENYDKLKKMGSVRSCRIYYCAFALEWDAIYSHYGQSQYALDFLKSDKIDNVGALNAENYFYRTSDRVAPHNAFTSGKNLNKAIKALNYRQNYEKKYTGHFTFANSGEKINLNSKIVANKVEIGYVINKPWYEYNSKNGLYYRYQYGEKHIDDQTNKQLYCSNIIIQFVNSTLYDDNKSLNITLSGSGEGLFITNGKAEKITWKKDKQMSGQTKYYDESGKEIVLNTGKTWIQIVQKENADNVAIN